MGRSMYLISFGSIDEDGPVEKGISKLDPEDVAGSSPEELAGALVTFLSQTDEAYVGGNGRTVYEKYNDAWQKAFEYAELTDEEARVIERRIEAYKHEDRLADLNDRFGGFFDDDHGADNGLEDDGGCEIDL